MKVIATRSRFSATPRPGDPNKRYTYDERPSTVQDLPFLVVGEALWEKAGFQRDRCQEDKDEVMSAEGGSIRILAVDDHSLAREGIATFIAGQPDMRLVAEASNGREAIHVVIRYSISVALWTAAAISAVSCYFAPGRRPISPDRKTRPYLFPGSKLQL